MADEDDRGIAQLRKLDLSKIPEGVELHVSILKTTTKRYRVRASVGTEKARQEIGDRVMVLDDVVDDLYVLAAENMAKLVLRGQAAGAGKHL